MKASDSKWPYRPIHITNDGEKCPLSHPRREDLCRLTGVGIIPNEHLQGIETTLCADLMYPTTIIEFPPNSNPVRTDSPLLEMVETPFGLPPPCRILRREIDNKYCQECYNEHALLFKGLAETNLTIEMPNRISSSKYIQAYLSSEPKPKIQFVEEPNKKYTEYDCPLLGYREIIFPIFFETKVVAVFFIGQICLKNNLNLMAQLQKKFFSQHNLTNHPAMEKIMQAHMRWIGNNEHLLGEEKYQNLISEACEEIKHLETTLIEQMGLQRQHYIRKRIDVQIKEFRDNQPLEEMSGEKKLNCLWRSIEDCLKRMVSDFSIRYFLVFASGSLTKEKVGLLNVVAKAGDLPKELEDSIASGKLKFNMDKVSKEVRNQWITTVEETNIFNAIEGWENYSRETNLLRVFPVPLFPQASLVVLVGYYDWNLLTSVENRPREELSIALQSFFAVVLSALSSVLACVAEERYEKMLGRLTHELKVPVVAIRGAAEFIIKTPGVKKFFDYDYPGDIWSWTDLMGRLIDNADAFRYSDERIRVKPVLTHILPDVIASAIRQTGLLLREREFSARNIEYNKEGFQKFPALWLDRNGFLQVLFNLLSNAIKYAYKDPKAFRVEIKGDAKELVMLFRDWGPGIESGTEELIFEEGFRGENAVQMNVAGQGLGLWVVRQIVESHGGTIKVTNLKWPTEFRISLPHSLISHPPV